MAFLAMAGRIAQRHEVGREVAVPGRVAADTLGAIVMVESWFEHRSESLDVLGNRDLGLTQLSDYARDTLTRLRDRGALPVPVPDGDWLRPVTSISGGAAWLHLMLREADGDVALAVRAYRRGIAAARRGEGAAYADNVERKVRRHVRNRGAPPTWDYLSRRPRGRPAFPGVLPSSRPAPSGPRPGPGAPVSEPSPAGRPAGGRRPRPAARARRPRPASAPSPSGCRGRGPRRRPPAAGRSRPRPSPPPAGRAGA